ncbi:hypothetical protein HY772_00020 [Candidatus Woesearchaeota archaeon]|nr:hypothetical protein [Candidatus Woesearchaeota archaeon]
MPTAEYVVNALIVILLAEAIKFHSTIFKMSGCTLKGLPPASHPPYHPTTAYIPFFNVEIFQANSGVYSLRVSLSACCREHSS